MCIVESHDHKEDSYSREDHYRERARYDIRNFSNYSNLNDNYRGR